MRAARGDGDGIDPIEVTSVELLTTTGWWYNSVHKEIPLKFTAPATDGITLVLSGSELLPTMHGVH